MSVNSEILFKRSCDADSKVPENANFIKIWDIYHTLRSNNDSFVRIIEAPCESILKKCMQNGISWKI